MKVDKTQNLRILSIGPFQKLKQQFSERVENIFMIVAITSKTISGKKRKMEGKPVYE